MVDAPRSASLPKASIAPFCCAASLARRSRASKYRSPSGWPVAMSFGATSFDARHSEEAARVVARLLLATTAAHGEPEGYHGGENAGNAASPQRDSHARELGKHESRKCQKLKYDAHAVGVQRDVQERLPPASFCARQAQE